ncbi:hypothetical protein QSV08_09800 [Maribacter sp. BPC-D8]|uniref:hypothetical protein n=1 Tax=Maribacter sp. BPC-D8 TaxID=3053613 RepID=UPI002B45F778|nr:hypothetical protein [Maribacter sp. BPC-D8]WRI31529.1 hypothetical protein QSV08_09800 [Maribacter sp. BPC-D8]
MDTKKLILNHSKIKDNEFFCIDNHTFIGDMFCTEKFKNKTEALGIDVTFIEILNAVEFVAKAQGLI